MLPGANTTQGVDVFVFLFESGPMAQCVAASQVTDLQASSKVINALTEWMDHLRNVAEHRVRMRAPSTILSGVECVAARRLDCLKPQQANKWRRKSHRRQTHHREQGRVANVDSEGEKQRGSKKRPSTSLPTKPRGS